MAPMSSSSSVSEMSGDSSSVVKALTAPINFTWVAEDELAGMGWPKSRDQLSFLVEEGIEHLVTLSSDKLPPHYAFPELRWSLIPVEDFSGPNIGQIVRFLNIVDEARKLNQAVGVHCAEGRGRTGVMCACFLIYYHDVRAWDAIRVMRRQRPGSVERKVQERTVVTFEQLLKTFGKAALETLADKEKVWREMEKRRLALGSPAGEAVWGGGGGGLNPSVNVRVRAKRDKGTSRQERSRRCISMPKFNPEEEEDVNFRLHLANFYSNQTSGSASRCGRSSSSAATSRSQRRSMLTQLKPVNRRASNTEETATTTTSTTTTTDGRESSDLSKHFRDFMASAPSASLKRVRSLSQPKDGNENRKKDSNPNKEEESKMKSHTSDTNMPTTSSTEKYYARIRMRSQMSEMARANMALEAAAKETAEKEKSNSTTAENNDKKDKEEDKVQSAPVVLVRSASNNVNADSRSSSSSWPESPRPRHNSLSSSPSSCRFSRLRLSPTPTHLPPTGLFSPFASERAFRIVHRHNNQLRSSRPHNLHNLWSPRVVLTGRTTVL